MNCFLEMSRLINIFKITPSDENYEAIDNLMKKYKANPPALIKNLKSKIKSDEKFSCFLEPNKIVKRFSNFMACPSDENYETYLMALKEYQTEYYE